MRYYVYCTSDEPSVDPYILAEVVRDEADDRSLSLAAALAGPRAAILTRRELMSDPAQREALRTWDARDDSSYERETSLLWQNGRVGTVRLHVVGSEEREPPKPRMALPADANMREKVLMARGIREISRQLIRRSQELRAELQGRRMTHDPASDQVG